LARAAELASSDPLAGSDTGTFAKVMLRMPEANCPDEEVEDVLFPELELER